MGLPQVQAMQQQREEQQLAQQRGQEALEPDWCAAQSADGPPPACPGSSRCLVEP